MRSLKYYFTHINITMGSVIERFPFLFRSNETYLKTLFRLKVGHPLDFTNPKRFNEKLQWLKLYDHNPDYTDMVDKYKAKEVAKRLIGDDYIIPTIERWTCVEQIDWDSLPHQFVLKTTHGGGGVGIVICKDKEKLNKKLAKRKLSHSMHFSDSYRHKEWPYKNVDRCIIAEQYIEDFEEQQLVDYKFHCFNGQPKIVLVCRNRFGGTGMDKVFYDMDWNQLTISRENNKTIRLNVERPAEFEEMKRIAQVLSNTIPFVRIDLYLANHRIFFGEFTFFPASGLSPFYPDEWDFKLGEWLTLPGEKRI